MLTRRRVETVAVGVGIFLISACSDSGPTAGPSNAGRGGAGGVVGGASGSSSGAVGGTSGAVGGTSGGAAGGSSGGAGAGGAGPTDGASGVGGVADVQPSAETDPVPNSGDAADDPAVWVHPSDPSQSIVIGTDKQGGIAAYELSGRQLQYLAAGELNNVDVRYGLQLGGRSVSFAATANRTNDSIAVFAIDPSTRQLSDIASGTLSAGIVVYGSCLYRSRASGKYYFFVNSEDGEVEQYELGDDGAGRVRAAMVRSFDVGSQTEGCVADDELGQFYIGEEAQGIWKYGAEPDAGTGRVQVDRTGAPGHLTADVEGLTLYYAANGAGYLIASSQGNDSYVIYQRGGSNAYVATFRVVAGGTIDGSEGTDGIDVTSFGLGSLFPQGVFIAQDGSNAGGNQNFKLVPWQSVANAFAPALTIDPSVDPRR